ncbi:MAG: 5-oxoprolinase (ATP-hydrolyzing) [Acidobacteriaceae bacterium]|nr:5-oxoprolinase (ATP-hydrolyzing) [Acidobacteriaceae bacterium]
MRCVHSKKFCIELRVLSTDFQHRLAEMRIAIDTGGTFTDCVYLKDGAPAVLKLPSTPDDPARSVLEGIRRIAAEGDAEIRHGTTIGTNALLERKGARVAFVTTSGFEDTIAIGRQARQHLSDWLATPAPCIVPKELRFGVEERVSAEGEILLSPSEQELVELREKIRASGAESIAISLLFSFANSENESRVAAALGRLARADEGVRPYVANLPVSISHHILPEFREYERAATVVVNAYLAPKAGDYVRRLEAAIADQSGGALYVMQSSGGIISANVAAEEPVRTVLSGPAGGVIGAHRVTQLAGFDKIISFDMGGTSTDVALIDARGPQITNESRISEIPVSVPMLDIHTVGAGGGSLAWFDRGGILHVGPASAGAKPGPICYGRGEQPTVTDANLVLNRLDPELALAGTVRLDEARTRRFMDNSLGPISSVQQFAAGILQLAEAEMEKAIRLISVERGHDPREFTLVAFGGAGPLHACSLARALGIPRVLVPAMPGALSALGILGADVVRDYSRTVMTSAVDRLLDKHFSDLEANGCAEFKTEGMIGISTRSADLRYAGQGYEINVPAGPEMLARFHEAHRKRYGHSDKNRHVEVVNVRVRMIAASEQIKFPQMQKGGPSSDHAALKKKNVMFANEWMDTTVLDRNLLFPGNIFKGPAIVHEYSATTVVPPGCMAKVDSYSNLVIEV